MHADFQTVIDRIGTVPLGKPSAIKLAATCLLARGHLLIEDLPGMSKTTLAHMHWPECSISNKCGFSSRATC